jgi:hypothetical protein
LFAHLDIEQGVAMVDMHKTQISKKFHPAASLLGLYIALTGSEGSLQTVREFVLIDVCL